MIQTAVKKLTGALLDLLFPPHCPFCGEVEDTAGICPDCEAKLPRTEEIRQLSEGLRCAAPLRYDGLARDGLRRCKFRNHPAAAEPMGELLAQRAAEAFSGEFGMVTWVPVSRKRLRKRGYDQSRLLAESACRLWDTQPEQLLKKVAETPPQSGLSDPAARRANVLGAYEARQREKIRGARILLVDDICTTGATLNECARVLRDAGAESVVAAAVALTPKRNGK